MRKLFPFLIILSLLAVVSPLAAQAPKFLPKKSHKLTGEELKGIRISSTLPVYTPDGVKLDQMQAMKLMSSVEFITEIYGDKQGNPVALVLKESTEQEKEAKLRAMMATDRTGDWKDKEAPNFAAMNMEREGINLGDHKGSVVALNFWFIGCKPCIMEMPELNELVKKYEGQNVKFIAIALDPKNDLIPFLQRTPFLYDIIPNARRFAKMYNVSGYPTHFLIDKEGKVQFYQTGYNGALVDILDRRIEQMLDK